MPGAFLITGVSSGLGRAFATAALEAGHTVVGTVRTPDHAAAFEQLAPGRAHARLLDVTDTDAIAPTVAAIEEEVGRIDVLVNNPPTHLILGSDALRLVADARSAFDAETAAWSELSKSTDYPDGEQIA